MGGRVERWMKERMEGRMDGLMDGWKKEWIVKCRKEWLEKLVFKLFNLSFRRIFRVGWVEG